MASEATGVRVRRFTPDERPGSIRFGEQRIVITPAVTAAEGGPLSTYSASFGAGERAPLPAPYGEVWVVVSGVLQVRSGEADLRVTAGEHLHVPQDSPG